MDFPGRQWLIRLQGALAALRHESEARAAFAAGRADDALLHARALYEFDLTNPWANYLLACHHLDADRYGAALPHFERAASEWPDDPQIQYALGLCHDYLDHPRAAVAAYQAALSLTPDWVKPLKDIGRNLYLLADYPAAEAALRRYCDQSPDDKQAHDLLGYVCYRQGKFMASFAHYERARRLDPLNPKLERNARLLYSRSAMN